MKHECSIVQDLLPLYLEDMVSEDTSDFISAHLDGCPACSEVWQRMKMANQPVLEESSEPPADVLPMHRLRRLMLRRKLQIVVFAALLGLAVLVAVGAALDAPMFFPYAEDLLRTVRNPDGSVTVAFSEDVTGCRYTHTQSEADQLTIYFVEAWRSLWDDRLGQTAPQAVTVGSAGENFAVFYVQNSGEDDVCLYRNVTLPFDGMRTLPRLVLGYYVLLALGMLAVLSVAWLLCKGRMRRWMGRFWLLPASYLAGHVAVCGFQTVTYAMQRQFPIILLMTVLIYAAALVVVEVIRLTGEIRRTPA